MLGTILVFMLLIVLSLGISFSIFTMTYVNKRRCKEETKTDLWLMVGFGIAFAIALITLLISFIVFIVKYVKCYYLIQRYKKQLANKRKLFFKRLKQIEEFNNERIQMKKDKLLLEQVSIQTERDGLSKEEELELVRLASMNRERLNKRLTALKGKSAVEPLSEDEIIDLENIEIILKESKGIPTITKSMDNVETIEKEQKMLNLRVIFEEEPFSEIVKLIEDKDVSSDDYKVGDLLNDIKKDKFIGYLTIQEGDENYLDNYIINLFDGTEETKALKYNLFKLSSLNEIGYKKNDSSSLKTLVKRFEISNKI